MCDVQASKSSVDDWSTCLDFVRSRAATYCDLLRNALTGRFVGHANNPSLIFFFPFFFFQLSCVLTGRESTRFFGVLCSDLFIWMFAAPLCMCFIQMLWGVAIFRIVSISCVLQGKFSVLRCQCLDIPSLLFWKNSKWQVSLLNFFYIVLYILSPFRNE